MLSVSLVYFVIVSVFLPFFYANLQHLPFSLLLPGHKLIPLFYSSWFSQLKMSAEGESSTNHAVVPTDAPGTASTVDMDTNKHILTSLNNIDQTMGQMAGLIAKFCEDRRPSGRKGSKRSADPP